MRFNDVIYLLPVSYVENDLGAQEEKEEEPKKVYANKFKIGLQEFFEAKRNDIKPECAFEIMSFEYSDEPKFIYQGKTFDIYRISFNGDRSVLYGKAVIADEN